MFGVFLRDVQGESISDEVRAGVCLCLSLFFLFCGWSASVKGGRRVERRGRDAHFRALCPCAVAEIIVLLLRSEGPGVGVVGEFRVSIREAWGGGGGWRLFFSHSVPFLPLPAPPLAFSPANLFFPWPFFLLVSSRTCSRAATRVPLLYARASVELVGLIA